MRRFRPAPSGRYRKKRRVAVVLNHDRLGFSSIFAALCRRPQSGPVSRDRLPVLGVCDRIQCPIRLQHERGHCARDQRDRFCQLGHPSAAAPLVAAHAFGIVLGFAQGSVATDPDRPAVADHFGCGVLRDGLPGDDSFRSHHGSRPIAWYGAVACGQCLERSILGDALARQLREFSAFVRVWAGFGHGLGAVYALSRLGIAARRAGARVERRPLGGPAHATLAPHPIQPAAHHPRAHRVGSEGRAVHGGAARRSAAALAERRRAGFFAPGR